VRTRILESALDVGLGRRYGHTGVDAVDCVIFAEAILHSSYPEIDWSGTHADLMILDAARPFSNVEALVGLGFREVPELVPGRWHYCQGWRKNGAGHCFLIWSPPSPEPGRPYKLEATNARSDWYAPTDWTRESSRYGAGLRLVLLERRP
jgi:hypothetical protein